MIQIYIFDFTELLIYREKVSNYPVPEMTMNAEHYFSENISKNNSKIFHININKPSFQGDCMNAI